MRIIVDGSLNPEIEDDTRISESQGQTMLRTAQSDPQAEVVGMDAEVRPVVRAKLGGATTWSDVALFAGGRPTKVSEPLLEEWTIDLERNRPQSRDAA